VLRAFDRALGGQQLAELVARVREVVGPDWEKPAVGRPHVLPLYVVVVVVVVVVFGLRHKYTRQGGRRAVRPLAGHHHPLLTAREELGE